jgi:hypothetical protein
MISKAPDCESWGQELLGELSAGSKRSLYGYFWPQSGRSYANGDLPTEDFHVTKYSD